MAFGESLVDGQYNGGEEKRYNGKAAYPVEGVGKGVFTEIAKHFVVNFERSEIC